MINSFPQRVVICTKDVENITGKKYKAANRLLQKVRKNVGKTDDQLVTVQDFCLVTGIPEETVNRFLL